MDKIIIIDDNGIQKELAEFLMANKNHVRLHSNMDELSLSTNPLLKEIIKQYGEKHKVKIQSKDNIRFFKTNDIIRFEAIYGKTTIYMTDGSHSEISENISAIEEQLEDFSFLRIHPNHIVNLQFLSKISSQDKNQIELTSGVILPVTETHKELIIEFLNKYFK